MIMFDPVYFLFVAPAMALAFWAQMKVKSAYATASGYSPSSGLSGAEAAAHILRSQNIGNVKIEETGGELSDHYDPRGKVLRLSSDVYHGRTVAALGIAAHEAGHAIQDKVHYGPLKLRNGIVPLASVGGGLGMTILIFGFMLHSLQLVVLGIGLYSMIVLFQLINLPVEYDASARAKQILVSQGLVSPTEQGLVNKVLNAAALTYVAATLSAILTLLYYLFRSGLLGGRNDER